MGDGSSRRCTRCGEVKPLEGFSRDKAQRDGRDPRCKSCRKVDNAQWRAANPERVKANNDRGRALHPERSSRSSAEWRAANLERARAADHAKYRENPWRWQAPNARYRGASVVVEFTLDDLCAYLREHGMDPERCVYCEKPREEWDHATALILGGGHTIDNVVPSCRWCNRSKAGAERALARRLGKVIV